LLSPLDWALIESWQEREVPLHIILRGIERVFDTIDKQPNRKRTVKSLFYCKEEIEAQYAEWLESQVGKTAEDSRFKIQDSRFKIQDSRFKIQDSRFKIQDAEVESKTELFSDSAITEHLRQVSADLSAASAKTDGDLRETLERVLNRLADAADKYESAEKLEESLEKMDALIDETLLKTSDTARFTQEVEKQTAAYKGKMDAEVFQRTFDLMLLKKLRDERQIPRLSLFYL